MAFANPDLRVLPPMTIIGMHRSMSLSRNETAALWQQFMPLRYRIRSDSKPGNALISLQVYPDGFDFSFADADALFEKWAGVPASPDDAVPEGMASLSFEGGLYAVFHYKGLSTDASIFKFIFAEWLPSSGYAVDSRPHFEVLGEKYKNNHPDSEEEIWIPVKPALI